MSRFTNYSDEELCLVDQADIMEMAYEAACEADSPNSPDFEALLNHFEEKIDAEYLAERTRRFGPPCDLPL